MDVVATAGHVDHGKSTLVRALTGMEPDRWAEERRRGMTIDLGFAWTSLAGGRTVAFVDVPGHQRFLGNMLAGAGPAPAVLFVVAADEGWSRQSADHLAALHALGVEHGLIAVTKCDRADPAAAAQRAQDELARTSLGACDAIAVSGTTGAGLDELRTALERMLDGMPDPVTTGRVRLWVDRSFPIRGSGTVVTGTLTAGSLAVGDALALSSTGAVVRIRGLQSLGAATETAVATARVAVNLRGVATEDVGRGDALLTPDVWLSVTDVDVRLSTEAADVPAHVIAHLGSAAVPARVRPLGGAYARLHLDAPLPLAHGDRLVLRDPTAQAIVAGAVAVDVLVGSLRRRGAAAETAAALTAADHAAADRAAAGALPDAGIEVTRRGCVRATDLVRAGAATAGPPPAGCVEAAGWWISDDRWRAWSIALADAVAAHAAGDPLHPGLPRTAAAQAVSLPDDRLLDPLIAAAPGLVLDAQGVRAAAQRPDLPPAVARGLAAVSARLTADPFAAPETDDLIRAGLDARALSACVRDGHLVALAPGIYLLPDAPARAAEILGNLEQPFTVSAARQALATTRRVAVPLLEHLDRLGRTRRLDGTLRTVVPE